MRLHEILAATREINKRKLIGRLVRSEVVLQGTVADAAEAAELSPSTLYQIFNADWTITEVKLRSVEKALGLADNLLAYILAGDSLRIAALTEAEIRSGLRRAILAALTGIEAEEVEMRHDYLPAFV
jgi:hypothetical protein